MNSRFQSVTMAVVLVVSVGVSTAAEAQTLSLGHFRRPAATRGPLDQGDSSSSRSATQAYPASSPEAVAEWQRQLTAAKARRSSARKLEYSGLAVGVIGLVTLRFAVEDAFACDYRTHSDGCPHHFTAVAGLGLMGGGFVAGTVGRVQARDAEAEVNALLMRGPRFAGLAVPLGDRSGLDIAVGPRTTVSYRVTW